ncbi:PRC-barrel domain-containing protein [Truepera radiovictrix]|uniref:PRC-barrel domain protein n=1 Tax=Truepera radiovictrix (strain DSM 17093 / CIP 108686 / LMG 22925 / RQ-24) TaxID=649638 RepID=D7CUM7_TRURR|nr:PRC-barrel domain-containing protein [Truepera radiovictrix]ADI14018.1 PRC-barrel domain protein [Truepera radiovictrix DSM 17093]WMT57422.1 PRC-barrel domain-containing protein [Truepera radiovictrix]
MSQMRTPEGRNLTAKTLIGDNIRNSQGENLGNVQDLMIDLEGGKIAYVVVSYGGFLGMGDKLFAVPWNAFRLDAENHNFILDVDQEVLKNAEGFDKNNWPNVADRDWGQRVHQHYGTRPYWDERV